MTEKELIESFEIILNEKYNVAKEYIKTAKNNESKIMDFNFYDILTNTMICLEAKTLNDARSNLDNFLGLFGKIIKGRSLNTNLIRRFNKCLPIKYSYGILIDYDQYNRLISYIVDNIKENDWINFCKQFDMEFIYLINSDENNFSVVSTSTIYKRDN